MFFMYFYHFHFFFWWNIEFLQQNINRAETEIGDNKLSVELYGRGFFVKIINGLLIFNYCRKKLRHRFLTEP